MNQYRKGFENVKDEVISDLKHLISIMENSDAVKHSEHFNLLLLKLSEFHIESHKLARKNRNVKVPIM